MSALYGCAYTEAALKFLEAKVPHKIRGQIKKRVEALATNPLPPGCKKIQGMDEEADPVYRVRQGDYRILYVVRNSPDQIIVLDIGHRKDVYR
jgi:mRNA interferase RelE/StbE